MKTVLLFGAHRWDRAEVIRDALATGMRTVLVQDESDHLPINPMLAFLQINMESLAAEEPSRGGNNCLNPHAKIIVSHATSSEVEKNSTDVANAIRLLGKNSDGTPFEIKMRIQAKLSNRI